MDGLKGSTIDMTMPKPTTALGDQGDPTTVGDLGGTKIDRAILAIETSKLGTTTSPTASPPRLFAIATKATSPRVHSLTTLGHPT